MENYISLNKRERNGFYILVLLIFLVQSGTLYFKMFAGNQVPVVQLTIHQGTIIDDVTNNKKEFPRQNVSQRNIKKLKHEERIEKTIPRNAPSTENSLKTVKPKKVLKTVDKKWEKVMVELNSADSVSIQKIYGVGKVLSKRIIKYRDMLGGFLSSNQLLDVYGIDPERYDQIKDQVSVDHRSVRRYNIFVEPQDSLSNHFLISWHDAKLIKAYCYSTNKLSIAADDILSIDGINVDRMKKALPYLILERPSTTRIVSKEFKTAIVDTATKYDSDI